MNNSKEMVTARLESFGVTPSESDDALLSLIITKVTCYVQNEINSDEIPAKLIPFMVDMMCGEYLDTKKTFSPDSLTGIDLSAAAKRIQEGDTTIEFAVDASQSAEGQVDSFIDALKSCGRRQFSCFRRLRW